MARVTGIFATINGRRLESQSAPAPFDGSGHRYTCNVRGGRLGTHTAAAPFDGAGRRHTSTFAAGGLDHIPQRHPLMARVAGTLADYKKSCCTILSSEASESPYQTERSCVIYALS
ncbi:uncharacterized protein LOC114247931 [Bombyx mandarina]|uniref:Uncharacterized protein LOC114240151 n=1 Tax=Bombyx mandarina TaxID=7092 RepID=A0A6J2K778_BOMMA|nr:uncharacterized protein LOC114240151 [Bombyx mandarina]XP_028027651.1 uncharacterized protein LOC114241112 [Bombyx mandarina]XP_028036822.1 uncharacterized protein LOC114247931 [Bombyx mandarina]